MRSLVELIAKGHVVVDFKYEWPDPNRRAQELYYIMPNMKSNKGYKRNNCPKDTTCKYLVDDKCSIHMVKPYECAQMLHNDGMKKYEIRHKKIMDAWRNYDGLKEIITVRGRVKVELSQ